MELLTPEVSLCDPEKEPEKADSVELEPVPKVEPEKEKSPAAFRSRCNIYIAPGRTRRKQTKRST